MDQELKKLILLQEVDNQIYDIESLAGDLPNRVEKKESSLSDVQSQLEIINEKLDQLEKENRKVGAQIEDSRTQLNKYKEQLFLVKTNKEYDALNHEIDHLKGIVSESEEKSLTTESEIEDQQESKKTNEAEIQELAASLKIDKKNLQGALEDSKGELEKLNESRKIIANDVNKSFLSRYDQLKEKRGSGVSPLNENCCGSCFSTLPPQMVIEIKSNNMIHKCPSCSVFMYFEEQTVEE